MNSRNPGNPASQENSVVLIAVLSDSATPSNLNACNFLTIKDDITCNPIFGMLSSRAIQNIPDMLGYL